MGRNPSSKEEMNKGAWTPQEDLILFDFIQANGEGKWLILPKRAGLKRCGKSCRLRWVNYLRPDIKRGNISPDEEDLIIRLHKLLGNRWSLIARRIPGRTDNEIKNYWNANLGKKVHQNNSITTTTTIATALFPSPTGNISSTSPIATTFDENTTKMMLNPQEKYYDDGTNCNYHAPPAGFVGDFDYAGELSCLSELLSSDHPDDLMLLDDYYWSNFNTYG